MEMSPNEMRNHRFSSSFRGYNKAEVDAFKESVAAAFEKARVEIQTLAHKGETLLAKYKELKGLEETIKTAMLEAQKNADQIITNARKESELIIAETKRHRDKSVDEKYRILSQLESKIQKLEFTKKSLYTKLRSEIEAHLQLVDSATQQETREEPTRVSYPEETGPSMERPSEKPPERQSENPSEWTPEGASEMPSEGSPEWTPEKPSERPSEEPSDWAPERASDRPSEGPSNGPSDWAPDKQAEVSDYQKPEEPAAQEPPAENIKDDVKSVPDEPPAKPKSEPPTLDMPDDEIDRVVDHFAAISQEEEKVRDGQSQENDF